MACTVALDAKSIQWKKVEPGLRYGTVVVAKAARTKPLHAHLLEVDLRSGKLTLRALRRGRRSGRVEDVVSRFRKDGVNVRAAINGDYFSFTGKGQLPYGMYLSGGQLFMSPTRSSSLVVDARNRARIGIFAAELSVHGDAHSIAVHGVGRKADDGRPVLYHGTTAPGVSGGRGCAVVRFTERVRGTMFKKALGLTVAEQSGPGALKAGELALVACGEHRQSLAALKPGAKVRLKSALGGLRSRPTEAISGGPRVLRAGKLVNEMKQEGFSVTQRFYLPLRHPRTAVGVSGNGQRAYLLVAEGRSERSSGLSAYDAGCVLRAAGAADAMLLDGGGSAAMYIGDRFVNRPMAKRNRSARGVANVLAVVKGSK